MNVMMKVILDIIYFYFYINNCLFHIVEHHLNSNGHTAEEKEVVVDVPMEEEEGGKVKDFTPSTGLTSAEARDLLEKWGRNELADKKKPKVSVGMHCTYFILF